MDQYFLCAVVIMASNDLQVLRSWCNKFHELTIQDFVAKLCKWQEGGYISANVWQEVREYVPQNLLPVAPAPAAPSSGRDEQPSGGRNQTKVNKGMISWSQ